VPAPSLEGSVHLKNLGGRILVPLLVAIAYLVAAKLGFTLAFTTKQVTAVWPPTGIALAALLLWGYRVWPGIWVGAFASNALSSEPVWTAAAIATGNTLAPAFGNLLLRRFGGFENTLERVRDVLLLALFGSAIAMTVSATNGVVDLALARIVPWSAFPSVWWVWWTGDAMGVLFVAPLLLTWVTSFQRKERAEGGTIELTILAATLLGASAVSFLSHLPLRFSVYPFVIWTALRFRQRETATVIAVVCGFAIWATAHDLGPWTSGSLDSRMLQLDSWMSVLAITGLVLGAVTAERQATRVELQTVLEETKRSAETLQAAFLPEHLPQRLGLRCDALYIAAEREALIGGDWYDAFDLPDGRIAFSMGDVTGHGLGAAVTAARLRQGIFAAAFDAEDPAEILTEADRSLRSRQNAPATAMVAIMSRDLSTISYSSAGHPPPIVAGPNIPAHSLAYGGLPFGLGMPVASETHTVALEPDAVILFYTDGLTEFKRDIERAERTVLQAVTRLVDDPHLERPAAFIQRSVMGSERPADDTALLVVQLSAALQKSWSYDSRNSQDAHSLRREIADFIRFFAPNEEELFGAELIIGEALANTVEHAPGSVSVNIDWTDTHPVVTISDAGPGLSRFVATLPADALNENGRGLFLIASLARDVKIESRPGMGTKMRIVLPTRRASKAPAAIVPQRHSQGDSISVT
jgi:integral membrane sensor domain MASE1/anti-sigma regulatory factor (Ser/Thr protein kinase)